MEAKNQARGYRSGMVDFQFMLTGLVIGSVAGAIGVLLFAPQSGSETRAQIKQKTLELRDRAVGTVDETVGQIKSKTFELRDRAAGTVDDTVEQIKSKTHQITEGVREKTGEFQHQGQEILVKQLDSVVAAAEAGKAAIQGS